MEKIEPPKTQKVNTLFPNDVSKIGYVLSVVEFEYHAVFRFKG